MTISVPSGVSTYVTDADNFPNGVHFNGALMYDVNYCGSAALYYLNAAGGYDAFLFEGEVKRTDKYTLNNYQRTYNNTTLEFGESRYLTEIKGTWECCTGFLSDEESKRFAANVFPTPQAWLHLLDTDEIFPVVITDTSAEYKTYANQNYQLVNYKLNVQTSQTETRN